MPGIGFGQTEDTTWRVCDDLFEKHAWVASIMLLKQHAHDHAHLRRTKHLGAGRKLTTRKRTNVTKQEIGRALRSSSFGVREKGKRSRESIAKGVIWVMHIILPLRYMYRRSVAAS